MTIDILQLQKTATQVRRDIVRMVTLANSGHPGGSMSSADILTALYFSVMHHDPARWTRDGKGQDMFILSAGHLTPVYYSVLARCGYFPVSELATFRKMGSRLQGHPSVRKGLPGITQASGSLGQGVSVAAGLALAKRMDGDPNRVFFLCGDGESEEGQIWEGAAFAAHHGLSNLIGITDWNGQQIDGTVDSVSGGGDLRAKWEAFGWSTLVADGHDMAAVLEAFAQAESLRSAGKPVMILFRTDMGHGVDFMAGTCKWHGKAPSAEQCENAMQQLEETLGDF
ncbi:MAG: transketolase [Bacteroidales bacterium]|nr:transketolase [Bacteroidales bacterium]